MWILECDNPEVLDNRRVWLRPGKRYLVGRTGGNRRKGEFKLDAKSVSRKHITLDVAQVKAGSGSLMQSRSKLTLKDEETKFGTELDGLKVERGEDRTLENDEHTFRLGKTEHIFRIKWRPVVLTFSFSSKETKGGKDPLAELRRKLEPLDIKAIIPYIPNTTTHVVQNKRNTAKGLQALINAKYIVTNTYVDALLEATTSGDPLEEESFSLLEDDFEKNWPDPLTYLPAKSKEPNERPAELFNPNSDRNNILEGYSFVFCDQVQFETLLQPITNAGGKPFEYKLELGETRCDQIVRYVKELAGEKSMGEFEDESEGKGVVVVRFRGGSKDYEDWAINLGDQVAIALGQRLIEQSEFMDAILMNDASMLRKPLQIEDEPVPMTSGISGAATQHAATQGPASNGIKPETSQPTRRVRGPIKSLFKGFDDDFDISAIPTATRNFSNESHMESSRELAQSQRNTSDSFMDSQFNLAAPDTNPQASQTQQSRKRPAPAVEDEEDIMDSLMPAATALKRRKLEEQKEAERTGKSFNASFKKPKPKEPVSKKEPKKEVNIKDAVRERRKAEDQAARHDEDALRETVGDMDIEAMKSLAVVEDMEIPTRTDRPTRHAANGATSDRWDDRWNGRKNFKKFRRRGEGGQARRGHTMIVPLEQVKTKDYGIGEEYWLDSSEKEKKKRKDKTQSQSQAFPNARSHPVEEIDMEPEEPSELQIPPELALNLNEDTPGTIDVEAPRTTRGMEQTLNTGEGSHRTEPATGAKRKAPIRAKPPPAKKQKIVTLEDSDESDSGGELKFRFRKKK